MKKCEPDRKGNEKISDQIGERFKRKIYVSLPWYEIYLYSALWIGALLIAAISFCLQAKRHGGDIHTVYWVKPWWSPLTAPMQRDETDHEWTTWKRIVRSELACLVVLYPLCSQLIKRFYPSFIIYFSALYSLTSSMYLIGVLPTLYVLAQIFIIFTSYLLTNNSV
ncbi:uncharacterized protein LOC111701021 isoform X3 [Eurytemora carolleeae]|uniref:uncharacterized protein LOC111701021 isoform X1 n=1 Tax=Eurytemora carolleeae TaxID=1294199 RepID=UPI000C75DFF9|nr:uncharacterized protein LOC111701021 isoform X1 [Eurytemora carolleeae]XP_023327900.1 uncharacterized protein LOC111701021 isoform X2 [Eurytemora carolleeae]XP_023327901.1 uncharacterized protein LOC111701021 isoform X3 [Eurytemora carolleeae]|eukprot:XP_023327899.1 uncharacterized protein LOC111701021 isoform X1 [Eurytemora affinis]